jgi:dienelactone hydrolase
MNNPRSLLSVTLFSTTLALGVGACQSPSPPSPAPVALAASAASTCGTAIDPNEAVCSQVITTGLGGLVAPVAICADFLPYSLGSPTQPGCTSPLSNAPGNRIAVPINMTAGSTDLLTLNGTPMCMPQNGTVADPQVWYTDPVLDLARYACVYTPKKLKPVPLVIFLPGSEADVSTLYTDTNLRASAAVDGFVLAGVQAFNTHEWSGGLDGGVGADAGISLPDGQHLDSFYRDATPGGCNNDIRFLDWLVDDLVSGGAVDPKQIYVTGWSNGAFFAEWYALERYATPTPGGNYVAAAAVYAGADPWANIEDTGCGQAAQYPTFPGVPIQVVHRTCDALVPCMLQSTNPVSDVEDWMTALATKIGDADGDDVMVTPVPADGLALPPVCMPYCSDDGGDGGTGSTCCSEALGLTDHLTWPSLQEPGMLTFLFDNPHP